MPSSIAVFKLQSGWDRQTVKLNSFSAAEKQFITLTGSVRQFQTTPFTHEFICDSGAEISVLPTVVAETHGMEMRPTQKRVEMANGTDAKCQGVVQATVKVGTNICLLNFFVVNGVRNGILGLDALGKLGVTLNTRGKYATISETQSPLQSESSTPKISPKCYHIRVAQSCEIQPFEERFIWGKLEDKDTNITTDAYIEGTERFHQRTGLLTAPIRISSEMMEDEKKIPICVLNLTDKPIRVFREQTAATIQELPDTHRVAHVVEANDTERAKNPTQYNPIPEISMGKQLTDHQKTQLEELIHRNKCVFDYPGNDGHTRTVQHTIPTGVSDPIVCPPRRTNLGLTQKINEAVENHVKAGHLTPSKSPWAFPIVPVLKPDKTVRLCVDYRPLNKITQNDPFPTGNLQEVLDNLSGAHYFSVIDLAQGYLQVPLAKEDRPKTAFRSPTGFWEWTRMPYGLKGSPATFSRLMQRVLGHIPPNRLVLYMDDICIVSKTFDEHLVNLQEVFDALQRHGLRIKAKKCALAMQEVTFLGHKVNNRGVQPAEQKVKAIRAWPAPKCLKEVQVFLGAVGWYRKFIKDFSTVARPLTRLLEKDVRFTWGTTEEEAFNTLRNALMRAPVLDHPDPSRPFIVTTDASKVGLGGELSQEDSQGHVHPVAYFSRALTKRERSYPTYDREVMAMRDTLKNFRYYLLGAKILLKTDHKPLLKILEEKDPFGRRATMMRDIAEFEPRIEYIRGQDNYMADALSRIGWNISLTEEDGNLRTVATISVSQEESGKAYKDLVVDIKDFQAQQKRDAALKPHISTHRNELGLLTRENQKQVLVPASFVPTLLSLAHDETAHQGPSKMLARIEPHYWWPKMKAKVETYAKTCRRCAATLAQGHRNAPLHQRPKETKPFALIEVDLKGPLPKTREGYDNIVVITDPCTKYSEMHPIRGQTSEAVCRTLRGWISRYGLPNKVHSDNGPCFISATFEQLCTTQNIEHTFSHPYRPQGNAGVERINRTMGEALTKLVDKHPKQWSERLPDVQLAYNTATHTSTGAAPYELVFKEHPRSKFETVAERMSPSTVRERTEQLRGKASELLRQAQESDTKFAKKRRERINRKSSFKPLREGQQVWKRNLRAKTFADRWMGPYVILRSTSKTQTAYVVRRTGGMKEEIVHYNYLKPYNVRPKEKSKPKKIPQKENLDELPLGTSDDSEDSDCETRVVGNQRRYPERIRRPPNRFSCK